MNPKLLTFLSVHFFFALLIYILYQFGQAVSPSTLLISIAGAIVTPFILRLRFGRSQNKKILTWLYYFSLCATMLITVVLFWHLSSNYIGNDEGSYIYESFLIHEGKIPFRDFISRAPFQAYSLTPIFVLFGFNVLTLKLIVMLLYVFSVFVIYLILKKYKGKYVALLGSTLIMTNPVFFTSMLVLSTTNVSILLLIISMYLLQKDNRYFDIINGILLGCLFFTRETTALYILLLLAYLIYNKTYGKLFRICLGGVLALITVVSFFMQYLSLDQIASSLFGIGHLGVRESSLSWDASSNIVGILLQSAFPFVLLLILFKKAISKNAVPFLIASLSFCIFYIFYFFKRGLFLTYAAEILVPFSIFTFLIVDFAFVKKPQALKIARLKITLICISVLLIYSSIYTNKKISIPENLGYLIGSGIPKSSFVQTKEVIDHVNPEKNNTILAGNLALVTETESRQFLDISRPMAYQSDSEVYAIYGGKTRDEIRAEFEKNPPSVIIEDYHLKLSLWNSIYPLVYSKYSSIYKDEYATVWKLN